MKESAKQAPLTRPRVLKIEEAGDPFKGGIKPKIRLTGHWLRRAGFEPGERVELVMIDRGVIVLTTNEARKRGCSQIPIEIDGQFAPDSLANSSCEMLSANQLICEQGGQP